LPLTTTPCVNGAELVTGPWEIVYNGGFGLANFDNPNCAAIFNSFPLSASSSLDLET
jgi:hypothetical protein